MRFFGTIGAPRHKVCVLCLSAALHSSNHFTKEVHLAYPGRDVEVHLNALCADALSRSVPQAEQSGKYSAIGNLGIPIPTVSVDASTPSERSVKRLKCISCSRRSHDTNELSPIELSFYLFRMLRCLSISFMFMSRAIPKSSGKQLHDLIRRIPRKCIWSGKEH